MNRVFRVRWNRTLNLWQCVSEKTASMGKSASPLHAPATVNQPAAGWSSFLHPLFSHVLRPVLRPVVVAVMGALLSSVTTSALAEPTWTRSGIQFTVTVPQGETYENDPGDGVLYNKFGGLRVLSWINRGTLEKTGEGTLLLDGPRHQFFWPTMTVSQVYLINKKSNPSISKKSKTLISKKSNGVISSNPMPDQ